LGRETRQGDRQVVRSAAGCGSSVVSLRSSQPEISSKGSKSSTNGPCTNGRAATVSITIVPILERHEQRRICIRIGNDISTARESRVSDPLAVCIYNDENIFLQPRLLCYPFSE
jgi:hypothetical protein